MEMREGERNRVLEPPFMRKGSTIEEPRGLGDGASFLCGRLNLWMK